MTTTTMTHPKRRTERLAELSPNKKLLLQLLQQRRQASAPSSASARSTLPPFAMLSEDDRSKVPVGIVDAYPLGLAQLGMIYHTELRLDDPTPAYHNVDGWHLRAHFDAEVFQRAVDLVVAAHPILRTSFDVTGFSEPMQLVHAEAHLPVKVIDLRHLPDEEYEREINAFLDVENRCLIDLTTPPLMRFHVHRRSEESFRFTLTETHAISDGWSTTSNLAEVFEVYFALLRGEDVRPQEMEISYRDFVYRERELLSSAECRAYWDRVLSDCNVVRLPRWPRTWRVERGADERKPHYFLDPDLVMGLQGLARQAGVPMKNVLLASYFKVLSLVSGFKDLAAGLVCNARPEVADGERLRGLFLNPLPLRVSIPDGSWIDLVKAVFDAEVEMLPYRVYPLQALQRKWGREQLVDAAFTYLNFHSVNRVLSTEDVEILDLDKEDNRALTHFTLSVVYRTFPLDPTRLVLLLQYDDAELAGEQIDIWWGYFRQVLESMAADPEGQHHARSYLTVEQRELLGEWNRTEIERPETETVVDLFASQVASTPDAVALEWPGGELDYAGLAACSDLLARRLSALGVGPETPVALHMERGPELVVAVLAVLKAGGVYLPLDISYPRERLLHVLETVRPAVALSRGQFAERLAEIDPEIRILRLDEAWQDVAVPEAPLRPASADHLAYLLFTSGSTGRPKGVMVAHGGLANYLSWAALQYAAERGALLHSSIGFDLTVTSLLAPLVCGGKITLLPEEAGVEGVAESLRRSEGFGMVKLTPSHLEVINRLLPPGELAGKIATLVIGGEALWERVLEPWRLHAPSTRLINEYGPTEATIACSLFDATDAPSASGDSISIGRPLPNCRIHVLADDGFRVAIGTAGEIFIGGTGLARGYLGRAAETAVRFVPDPLAESSGDRLYRTGDLSRWLPDGNLEFLGRSDFQVKVRGHRIELGEIESVLGEHPAVREAVVTLRGETGAEAQLVAYLVGEAGPPQVDDVRRYLGQRLPEAMQPAFFVILGALPLTPNGKVDRRALPSPDHVRSELDVAFLAPRNPIEEVLCGIWSEVLKVEEVGIYDNFFRLGGHSLLATQVVSRLRRAFHVELQLQELFDNPTVATMAEAIDRLLQQGPDLDAPPIEPAPRDALLPLSFAQQRMWFLDRLMPGTATYNLPTALRLEGELRDDVLERCLSEVVRRHEVLRTTFEVVDERPVQRIHPPHPVEMARHDFSHFNDEEREAELRKLAEEEARRPFDLATGPMLRVTLIRLAPEDHAVLVTLHHVVSDGWSRGILVREISALYEAFLSDRPSPFAELEIQYADFAAWQRQWLSGTVLQAHVDYWRRQLDGAPQFLELPTDRPRPAVQSDRGTAVLFDLPQGLSESIKLEARRQGVTPFMWLLAVFGVLLSRWSGQRDVLVGSPIANRNRMEIEGLIGIFVNTLVLRVTLGDEMTFGSLLQQIRERTLGAYAHQDLPFERLVDALDLDRDVSHAPLFQVMFTLQNAPRRRLELTGLSLSLVPADQHTARFDVTLSMEERGSQLSGTVEYNVDLFDGATIARSLEHFKSLLTAFAQDSDREVGTAPLTTPAERHQLLHAWQGAPARFSAGETLPQLFSQSAAMYPEVKAVSQGAESLTYRELELRSAGLAARLRASGVGPEVRVGLCLERSPDLLVGLLAIARAGGAYVPLDPTYPLDRLRYMLEDSGAEMVLTQKSLSEGMPGADSLRLVLIDGEDWASRAEVAPEIPADGNAAAYVIHTSGSTGRPKGVVVSHAALVNFLNAMRERPGLGPEDVLAAVTSLSFDISNLELLLPLISGARVEIVERETTADGRVLAERLAACGATLMQATPATWRLLIESGWEGDGALKALCGGEALSAALAADLTERTNELWNVYGPTETTIWSTVDRVLAPAERITVGRPIHATSTYMLDRRLEPQPIGLVGDLYIGGAGLARGYLGRPAETAGVFLPDPFSEVGGARLYRTGDLARGLAGGRLEFLGRRDHQVKVRGFRIELAEIETVLGRLPEIAETVVVAAGETGVDKRLVAYVVARDETLPPVDELRAALAERLPEYMVPAIFVPLDELPRTQNGKVDRKALPAPGHDRPELAQSFVAPSNELERKFAEIWSRVLGLDQVGARDNFFDLGGDSLLLVQVHRREQEVLGREFSLTLLFQYPTISALVGYLERGGGSVADAGEERAAARVASADRRRSLAQRRRTARKIERSDD